MPTDKIIGMYSNWVVIERSFKTVQKSQCFILNGIRQKVCFGEVPENKKVGLMKSMNKLRRIK